MVEVEGIETAEGRLDPLLRSERHTIGANRPRDVLHLVLAKVQEIEREPIANLRMDRLGDANSARRCKRLQAGGNVDAVAHQIVAVHDDIAEIDADAKPHAVRLGNVDVALVDRQLDFGRAPHRLDRAGELGNDAVAGAPEDAATMVGDQPVDDLTMGLQRRKRRLLILAHEPAVADHIGCKDGGHSALNAIHGHARPRGTSSAILRYKPADREARKPRGPLSGDHAAATVVTATIRMLSLRAGRAGGHAPSPSWRPGASPTRRTLLQPAGRSGAADAISPVMRPEPVARLPAAGA